jgi:hypothetical protein
VWDLDRATLASRRRALTATTDITLMHARLTATTVLTGSQAACSPARVPGMAGEAVGLMDAVVGVMGVADTVTDAAATAARGTPDEGATAVAGLRASVAATAAASMVVEAEVVSTVVAADSTAAAVAMVVAGTDNRH